MTEGIYRCGSAVRGFGATRVPERARRPADTPDSTDSNSVFSYDSDDSSLSSNASGSAKSSDKGAGAGAGAGAAAGCGDGARPRGGAGGGAGAGAGGAGARGWRAGAPARRRAAHDRQVYGAYPYQIKFTPDDLLNGSKWDTLSQEIWDKFVTSQQTEESFRNKMSVWRQLYVTVRTLFPRYGLYMVGSTMSGFALDASDMDVCLFVRAPPGPPLSQRSHALLHLSFLLHCLRELHHNVELIQAKVPILKFNDATTGVQVDLNCNNVVGIRNTNLLYCYASLDWRVRPLVVAAKLWARAQRINDARRSTLSSYALTLMVLQFLQCGASPAVLPVLCARTAGAGGGARPAAPAPPYSHQHPYRSHNRQSIGELFLQLLRYYAEFPYERMAVSVRAGRPLPAADCRAARSFKNDPHQWKLLCVEEPFDLTNAARSVYDPQTFERIVDTFRTAGARLAASLRLADAWPASAAAPAAARRR